MKEKAFVSGVALAALAFLAAAARAVDLGALPPADPTRALEYAEDEGALVHLKSFQRAPRTEEPGQVEELRNLVRATAGLGAGPACSGCRKRGPAGAPFCCWCGRPQGGVPSATPQPAPGAPPSSAAATPTAAAARRPRRPAPEPTPTPAPAATPAAPDPTRLPNDQDQVKCPSRACGAFTSVEKRFCDVCGAELADTEEIRARRQEVELQRQLFGAGGGGPAAATPTPAPAATPEAPPGPSFGAFGLPIEQLGTGYQALAREKLMRAGGSALGDLTLALQGPDEALAARVREFLKGFATQDSAPAIAEGLRLPTTRPAAELALAAAGPAALPALFGELEADQASSAEAAVRLAARQGEAAVAEVERRLTPALSRIFPRLGDVLVKVGGRSLPLLVKLLAETPDPYVLRLAQDALVRLGPPSAGPVLARLAQPLQPDRLKLALEVLGQVRAAEAVDALVPHLRTRRLDTHLTARKALAQIGTERSLGALVPLLETGDDAEQSQVLDLLLGSTGPSQAALVAATADDSWRVRSAGVRGLGKLGRTTPEALAALERAAQDRHGQVKREAQEALARLK